MPRGPSEAIVTKFLRDALAVDAVGVPELDEKARAAGLLGEGQSITHTKAFRGAKKSLGIRSLRVGFGARSRWLWQLPRQSEGFLKTDSGTTRERRGPIPIDWVRGVACLDPDRPPNDVPRLRWRQFVGDCKIFVSSPESLAERASLVIVDIIFIISGDTLLVHRERAVIDQENAVLAHKADGVIQLATKFLAGPVTDTK
jgi:hypothetical protein